MKAKSIGYESVWDALADTPEEAATLRRVRI
jgi:predicted XRE-type DNA-binding protein